MEVSHPSLTVGARQSACSIKIGESNVRIFGNTALIKGTMEIVNNANTPPTALNLSVLQVWLKGAKGWQLVGRHSNKLP